MIVFIKEDFLNP